MQKRECPVFESCRGTCLKVRAEGQSCTQIPCGWRVLPAAAHPHPRRCLLPAADGLLPANSACRHDYEAVI